MTDLKTYLFNTIQWDTIVKVALYTHVMAMFTKDYGVVLKSFFDVWLKVPDTIHNIILRILWKP